MGARVAEALGPHSAVLLKNHGVVIAARPSTRPSIRVIMLENGAQIQLDVEAAGEAAPEFSRADIEKLKHDISRADQFEVNFDYLVRRAKRREGKT